MGTALAFRGRTLAVALLSLLLLTACQERVPETPPDANPDVTLISPNQWEEQPLCGLERPGADAAWRVYWRDTPVDGGVFALLRAERWLWVGTPRGLARIDPQTLDCTLLARTGTDPDRSLPEVAALVQDPRGCLWVVGDDGVARHCNAGPDAEGTWRAVEFEYPTHKLSFDAQGNLWSYRPVSRSPSAPYRHTGHEPPPGEVWEGELITSADARSDACDRWFSKSQVDSGGLYSFQSPSQCQALAAWRGRLATLTFPPGLERIDPFPPLAAGEDELWLFARRTAPTPEHPERYALLHLTEDGDGRIHWRGLLWPFGPPGYSTRLVIDEARGGVWVGGASGLIFADGQSVQKLPLSPGDWIPVGPHVTDLVQDRADRLWAATSEGLLRWDPEKERWHPTEINQHVLITPDDQSGLWAISDGPGGRVSHFGGAGWQHQPKPPDWPCVPRDIAADAGGGLWMSSHACDLQGFDGQAWRPYPGSLQLRGALLARGPDGELYAAQDLGQLARPDQTLIWRYDGTAWHALPNPDPTREGIVTALGVDTQGGLWAGYWPAPSVYRFDGETWQAFSGDASVFTFFAAGGDLWIGAEGVLYHYADQTWQELAADDALIALAQDGEGRLWAGGMQGLYVYDVGQD